MDPVSDATAGRDSKAGNDVPGIAIGGGPASDFQLRGAIPYETYLCLESCIDEAIQGAFSINPSPSFPGVSLAALLACVYFGVKADGMRGSPAYFIRAHLERGKLGRPPLSVPGGPAGFRDFQGLRSILPQWTEMN